MSELFTGALATGADVSMIALFFMMWKFDRRMIKIEMKLLEVESKI